MVSAVTGAGGLALPVASLATTDTVVPPLTGVVGLMVQLPVTGSAVVLPIGAPLASRRVTVTPGSAVPVKVVPLLGLTTGAGGAVLSTVTVVKGLLLPAASCATTVTWVPSARAGLGVKLQAPDGLAAVSSASTRPLSSVSTTRLPGSAVPLSAVPVVGWMVGAAGGTASTVPLTPALVLPAVSVAVMVTLAPLASGELGRKLQLPDASALTWPSTPLLSLMVTVLPASAVPPSWVPV